MRRALATFVVLAWGLWFGGLVVLFMAVTSLFATFSERREIAGEGAADIFRAFNRYQLALSGTALVATFAWRIVGPPQFKNALFALFAAATIAACITVMYLAPHIERLQAQGLTHTAQFNRLHGYSMVAYCIEMLVLLVAGLLLPWAADRKHVNV